MIVIGLTGSIGMGKSTVAAQFKRLGLRVSDADAIVHRLLEPGGAAAEEVGKHFPAAVRNGEVDRKRLGDIVFHDDEKMRLLENILHPLVVAEENRFIEEERKRGAAVTVLEIPLLFETGGQKRCDAVVTVTAPRWIQKRRVLKRSGMTEEKFRRILARQMPDREKRARADFVVQTGLGKSFSLLQVKNILKKLHARNRP